MIPQLPYSVAGRVQEVVAALGRTEDVRFSPGLQRLAVAAYTSNRVVVFDIRIESSQGKTEVALTGGVDLSSPAVHGLHGLAFIDDDTIVVTSRERDVAIFSLPPGEPHVPSSEVLPLATWTGDRGASTVSVSPIEKDLYEVLICDNAAHSVTRHVVERHAVSVRRSSELLLRKHLSIPDGVSVSPDRRWMAVSNHGTHNVLMYERASRSFPDADPDGILRRVYYPHGLCFSPDGDYLFVADAGAPYVHVYARHPDDWRGVRYPIASARVMDDALFRQGHSNPQEGGPKGLDIAADVIVLTSEYQPLAFFHAPTLLHHARHSASHSESTALDIDYELRVMQTARSAAAEANALRNSRSWRMMAPLRRLRAAVRGTQSHG
jgi:hypothetical protein